MADRRWIVREGDGTTLLEIVARAGGDPAAIHEGRVFIGRKRVKSATEMVRVGDEVSVASLPTAPPLDIVILAAADDLVAVNKPAGIPTIADHAGAAHALVVQAARSLGIDPADLHPTSRLDREVSGVVLFAKTTGARERLARARETHTYVRRYIAIAAAAPDPDHGIWDVPIGRAKDPRHRAPNGREAVAAVTHFATVARAPQGAALLALAPITGRTHQLRVHASHAHAPLLGDRIYGGPTRLTLAGGRVIAVGRIALHAARVTVPQRRGKPLTVDAPVPPALGDLWLALGGDAEAWDTARACPLRDP